MRVEIAAAISATSASGAAEAGRVRRDGRGLGHFRAKILFSRFDHDRSRLAHGGEAVAFDGRRGDRAGAIGADEPLDDRARHRSLVDRLQRELTTLDLARTRHDVQQRHGIEPGLGEASEGIREPRPWNGGDDAGPPGDARVTIRHECRSHLMRRHDRAQAASLQRLESIDRLRARQPENEFGAFRTQRRPEQFRRRACHVSRTNAAARRRFP